MTQLAGACACVTALSSKAAESASRETPARRFEEWILDYQIASSDLCRYYRFGPHQAEESPLATAYAIVLLGESHPDVTDRLSRGLAALQQRFAGNPHVGGGVPSIANDGSLLFYASDALAATKALVATYNQTHQLDHLHAAAGFVEFVHRLANGERAGFLPENFGFPMQYATPGGAYQNWLVPNVAMLFWDALRDYADAAGDAATARLFERGRSFLLRDAQAPNGAYYDHYDPGYPPRAYSRERWRWFKVEADGRRIAIGDNMMMSALGAARLGDATGVDRFLEWARPNDGAFYAYIDVDSGGSGFQDGDPRYFDVVSSAMYYGLLAERKRLDEATRRNLERIFALSAAVDGGYRWGLHADGPGWVQDSAEALVTGYWIAKAS